MIEKIKKSIEEKGHYDLTLFDQVRLLKGGHLKIGALIESGNWISERDNLTATHRITARERIEIDGMGVFISPIPLNIGVVEQENDFNGTFTLGPIAQAFIRDRKIKSGEDTPIRIMKSFNFGEE